MAENLAQEIRDQETFAKNIITNAKSEAAKMLASAQTDAEQSIKTTKQQCHRQWRESVANAEREAEARAKDILIMARKRQRPFMNQRKGLLMK